MTRRSPCTDPTHVRNAKGQFCQTCKNARRRERWRATRHAGTVQPIQAGVSLTSVGQVVGWQTRRARYGDTGFSAEATARISDAVRRRQRKTFCVRGHLLAGDNVRVYTKANGTVNRHCRQCTAQASRAWKRKQRAAGQRPEWVTVGTVRLHLAAHDAYVLSHGRPLWTQMLDAHPDRGGTQRRFEVARRRWERWLAQETAWYAAAGVPLPEGLKRRTDDTSREAA